ncbi:MAG: succinate dehydrogenase [Gammaproteobacteria bacterium]|jgi:succinate dehydrogenase / fumarate reductase cytochrome b subunit|nr:succinate dehydrogenase [Gammaproteobacteria bacterium]
MSLKSRNVDLKSISKYWMSMNAIVSILHRISGIILFLLIPFMLWLLDQSLHAESSFQSLQGYFGSFEVRFLVWILLSALIYHLLAGLKHLLMDIGFLESIKGSRYSSMAVFALSLVIIIALGVGIIW